MKLSANAFNSMELRAWIDDNNEVDLLDLYDYFNDLLSLYVENENGIPLKEQIREDWELFSNEDDAARILDDALILLSKSFNSNSKVIHIPELLEPSDLWNTIKIELKTNRRFLAGNLIDEDDQWDRLFMTEIIQKGTKYYRGRVNEEKDKPYTSEEDLSAPPREKALPGRANPYGIPYLYLTDSEATVIYELRSLTGDQVSIGLFETTKDLNLVSFTYSPDSYSIFSGSVETLNDALQKRLFLKAISTDMQKPVRRYDDENLDYLPTQFVCEYIRLVVGADGIVFPSSRLEGGTNIVLFDKNSASLKDSYQRTVGRVTINLEEAS